MRNYYKNIFLLVSIMMIVGNLNAQTFNDYKDFKDGWFKIYIRNTSANSTYTPNYSGFTANVGIRADKAEKWGIRTRYENPTLGDLIYAAVNLSEDIKNGTSTKEVYDDHAHGGGFFGWTQGYINVYASDKLLISPGISGGDYIFGSAYNRNNTGKKDQDPRGYYVVAGPAIMASYAANKFFWIDAYINYDIAVFKFQDTVIDKDYPNPSFVSFGLDLYTDKKIFGGFRLNKIVDKGYNNNKSSRLDFSLGFCF